MSHSVLLEYFSYLCSMNKTSFTLVSAIVCLALITGTMPAAAQPMSHLGLMEGLSNGYVTSIAEDRRGIMWFGTESGLNIFDGRHFTVINISNSPMRTNAIASLYYDEDRDILWVGTRDGLCRMKPENREMTMVEMEVGSSINNVVTVIGDGEGGVWAVNQSADVFHADSLGYITKHFNRSNTSGTLYDMRTIFLLDKTHLMLGYAGNGFGIMDVTTGQLKNFPFSTDSAKLPGSNVYRVIRDRYNRLWMGTNAGLTLFDEKNGTFTTFSHSQYPSLPGDHIYDLTETPDGQLLIGIDAGGVCVLDLCKYNPQMSRNVEFDRIESVIPQVSVSSANIRSIFVDLLGNIWIGNYNNGIDFIGHRHNLFETVGATKDIPVRGMLACYDGSIFIGGNNTITQVNEGHVVKRIDLTPILKRQIAPVQSMFLDSGIMYVGMFDDGLLVYDFASGSVRRLDMGSHYIDVCAFLKLSDGRILVGAEDGMYVTDGIAVWHVLPEIKSSISEIVCDRQGKIWLMTYGSGVYVILEGDVDSKSKEARRIQHICFDGMVNCVSDGAVDSKGRVWMTTRNGLLSVPDSRYPDRYMLLSGDKGLAEPDLKAIAEDDMGNIWVSSNSYISRWNERIQAFENYDFHQGVPMGNFVDGSVATGTDGTIYFGSMAGACEFSPQYVCSDIPLRQLIITGMDDIYSGLTDGELFSRLDSHGALHLPYDINSLDIQFAVPDYAMKGIVHYAYCIEELNDEWIDTNGEGNIVLRNLQPGTYTLKIKAGIVNHGWDEQHIVTRTIIIAPPFWRSWWAIIFYALIVAAAIWWLINSYRRRIFLQSSLTLEQERRHNDEQLNNERLRFFTNITHELRTPLTLIIGPLEDLCDEKSLPGAWRKKVTTIRDNADRLLELVNQLLDFRKTETRNRKLHISRGNISQIIYEIGLRFKELNTNPKVEVRISVNTSHTDILFDEEIISTIVTNLMSNAVKYTQLGHVWLSLSNEEDDDGHRLTVVRVEDTGCGISTEDLPHIFERYYQAEDKSQVQGTGIGLALVKALAELHHAVISVDSVMGRGSTFTLTLPDEQELLALSRKDGGFASNGDLGSSGDTDVQQRITENTKCQQTDEEISILVVEDNQEIREYVSTSLCGTYTIYSAENGSEGLIIARNKMPDIIITDVMMPVMDGKTFCQQVKNDISTCHIPVIMLTAKDSIQDREDGYSAGADSYLTKPFTLKLLKARITAILNNRRLLQMAWKQESKDSDTPKATETQDPVTTESCNPDPPLLRQLDQQFLEKLNKIVNENIDDETLNTEYFASQMAMSHSTLYRKLKALTGLTINEYIRRLKLHRCAALLRTGQYSISEAAYMTGFNNLGHFRNMFKKEFSITPSEYIDNIDNNKFDK